MSRFPAGSPRLQRCNVEATYVAGVTVLLVFAVTALKVAVLAATYTCPALWEHA